MSSESQIITKPEVVQEVKPNGDNATAAKDKAVSEAFGKDGMEALKGLSANARKDTCPLPGLTIGDSSGQSNGRGSKDQSRLPEDTDRTGGANGTRQTKGEHHN
ncbi:hypothetical protein ABXV17_26795 [Vibrio harveyi]|jgi:hypothetical protein|uniref:hypothetical protein n=1 Tax=Vibrio harveyi TaxID=669 RepID=UPI0033958A11